jgi:hypothetical protein
LLKARPVPSGALPNKDQEIVMKNAFATLVVLLFCACAPAAMAQDEIEAYLVAPFTMGKAVTVNTNDGRRIHGVVVSGDDTKIVVERPGDRTEVATNRISSVKIGRASNSPTLTAVGSVIGGVGLGFAGAALGKSAGIAWHDDRQPGRALPVIGGVVFGLFSGWLGGKVARNAGWEQVTLKVTPGIEGQAPRTGDGGAASVAPQPEFQRVQPADFRR